MTRRSQIQDRSARTRRRLLLPILTLLLAAFVWFRSSGQAAERDLQVQRFVDQLVADAAPPSPSRATIVNSEPIISTLVREQIAEMVAEGVAPRIEILPGDIPNAAGGGRATHRAELRDAAGRRLLLRLVHPGDESRITIIGVELGRASLGDSGSGDPPPETPQP